MMLLPNLLDILLRQTNRLPIKQIERPTGGHADRKTDSLTYRHTVTQTTTDRRTGQRNDGQSDRQSERQTDRQTDFILSDHRMVTQPAFPTSFSHDNDA